MGATSRSTSMTTKSPGFSGYFSASESVVSSITAARSLGAHKTAWLVVATACKTSFLPGPVSDSLEFARAFS
jgi:hypothetical protein